MADDDGGHFEELYVHTVSRNGGDFVVEFFGNEGEHEKLNGLTINDGISELGMKVPDGYVFGGWKTGTDEYGKDISGAYSDGTDKYSTAINSGDVLYPKWIDEVAPSLELGLDTEWDRELVLNIKASDQGEGIDGYYVGKEDPDGEDGVLYISFSGETSVAISEPGTWYVSVCDKAGNFSESTFVVDEVTLESRMVVTPDGVSEEQDAQSTEKLISSNTHTLLCMDENKLSIEQFMPDDGKLISCVDDKGNFFEKSEFASIISRPEMSILLKYTESEHTCEWVTAKEASCTESGLRELTCIYCGAVTETEETEPTGHSYSEWTLSLDPTCTEPGERFRECAACGCHEEETVEACGHETKYTFYKVTGSCIDAHSIYKIKCANCDYVDYETGPETYEPTDSKLLSLHTFETMTTYMEITGYSWLPTTRQRSLACPNCYGTLEMQDSEEYILRCTDCGMKKMYYECTDCDMCYWGYWWENSLKLLMRLWV